MVAYGCIDRLTSHTRTTRRGRSRLRVRANRIVSHPVVRDALIVSRRSIRLPRRCGSRRRLRRRGQCATARSSHSPSRRRSSGSNRSNGSSARATIRLGSVSGMPMSAAWLSTAVIEAGRVVQGRPPSATAVARPGTPASSAAVVPRLCLRPGGSTPRTASAKIASNTESKAARSSMRFTSVSRAAQYSCDRGLRPVVAQRLNESCWAAGGHDDTAGVQPVDQRNSEGRQVDAA